MEDLRPAPGAANLRALVLEHVKRHYARLGRSPSVREIARALRVHRDRVRDALGALEAEGEVVLHHCASGGPIRIALPDRLDQLSEGDVLLILRRRGWMIDLGGQGPLSHLPPGDGAA